jgi:hypothetical protein
VFTSDRWIIGAYSCIYGLEFIGDFGSPLERESTRVADDSYCSVRVASFRDADSSRFVGNSA